MSWSLIPSQRDAIAELDRAALTDPQGHVQARIGFSVELYFAGGTLSETRLVLCGVLRDYADLMGDRLTHFLKVDANRLTPIRDAGDLDHYEDKARSLPATEPMDASVYGYPGGVVVDEPTSIALSFTATVPSAVEPLGLSSLSVSFPASFIAERGYDALIELTSRWSGQLPSAFGTAGYAVLFEHGIFGGGSGALAAFPAIRRFPGLDYTDPVRFLVESAKVAKPRIKSTNWLTVLSDEMLAELGGGKALGDRLGPSCPIHGHPSGAIVQAGEEPQLGDANRPLMLDDYRRVAEALLPLRFEAYRFGLFLLGEPFDSHDQTLRWVRRLD